MCYIIPCDRSTKDTALEPFFSCRPNKFQGRHAEEEAAAAAAAGVSVQRKVATPLQMHAAVVFVCAGALVDLFYDDLALQARLRCAP